MVRNTEGERGGRGGQAGVAGRGGGLDLDLDLGFLDGGICGLGLWQWREGGEREASCVDGGAFGVVKE